MADLQENLAKRVAPNEADKAMSARTRASIAKTFTVMAERADDPLREVIAGGGAVSERPLDDEHLIRAIADSDMELAGAVALNEAQWRKYLVMIPSMNVLPSER